MSEEQNSNQEKPNKRNRLDNYRLERLYKNSEKILEIQNIIKLEKEDRRQSEISELEELYQQPSHSGIEATQIKPPTILDPHIKSQQKK